jgi:gamma-glutamyltranspeptidase/glutathione hydrolase
VLQVLVNTLDFGLNLAEAVAAPRVHHQWRPDTLLVETGVSPDTLRLLRERGHKVVVGSASGSANSVMLTPEGLIGAADPRQRGTLADGY